MHSIHAFPPVDLERVADNGSALQAAQGSSDRRLAADLYEQFLAALVDVIESETNKTKVSLSKVNLALATLGEMTSRIKDAARSDSAVFAGVDVDGIEKILSGLVEQSVESLSSDASIDVVAARVGILANEVSGVEEALARLEEAFLKIRKIAVEVHPWSQSQSRV